MATYTTDAFQDTSKIKPRLLNSLLTAGHLRCAVCKVTMSAAGASGDVIEICKLPPESRVVQSLCKVEGSTALTVNYPADTVKTETLLTATLSGAVAADTTLTFTVVYAVRG